MIDRLFVYGTLMDEVPRFGPAEIEGEGTIAAEMFDLGEFPGAVPSRDNRMEGRVWVLGRPEETLERLDEYEEVDRENPAHGLFVRKRVTVTLHDGRRTRAWTYFYNGDTRHRGRISRWTRRTAIGNQR